MYVFLVLFVVFNFYQFVVIGYICRQSSSQNAHLFFDLLTVCRRPGMPSFVLDSDFEDDAIKAKRWVQYPGLLLLLAFVGFLIIKNASG